MRVLRPGRRLMAIRATTSRRGAIALVGMIGLLMATMICLSLVKIAVSSRQQARREQWRTQAAWLGDSGAARAVARLDADADYRGEQWEIPAAAFGGREAGLVEIEIVEGTSDRPERSVRVVSTFPRNQDIPARVTRTYLLPPLVEAESSTETTAAPFRPLSDSPLAETETLLRSSHASLP